ncbi:MAG: UDP-glucose/GDP-mannose dehydrogenase family protein [Chitinophagales bacterium]|nr:UDP-glucose/GDP-mannose dehydrogenase family protein [Chitinophagales bacterium]
MKIAVIGTGYVGLVTGVCFADSGAHVVCVDNNMEKVRMLQNGKVPFYEPRVEEILHKAATQKLISFTTELSDAVHHADIIFLALPTPEDEDGSADLSYVLNVADKIGQLIQDYKVIVNKSTVPVGTADLVKQKISAHYNGSFDVVSNPEFLREGTSVQDFQNPERIVIGSQSERACKMMEELYKPFMSQDAPIIFMDERSAEMTKYAANSFLATKITFINEIANLCDRVGANVDYVKMGIGYDSRIGHKFLNAGLGYGGGCFPKDVKALHKTAADNDYSFEILKAVMDVNKRQRAIFFEKIEAHVQDISNKTFAIWGLSFKPNTDDIREAPSIDIINQLLLAGAKVSVFDPEAMENIRKIYGNKLNYSVDMYEACDQADVLIVVTEWTIFKKPDFSSVKKRMRGNVIFDGRNIFEIETMKKEGFNYFSVGR